VLFSEYAVSLAWDLFTAHKNLHKSTQMRG
jgi:hypothetical protein